jgi:hypothetical protein
MENKDTPLLIGQSVQVVKKLDIPKEEILEFCKEKNMSKKATDELVAKSENSFEKINQKISDGLTGRVVSCIVGDNYVVRFEEEDDCFQFNIDDVGLDKRQYLVFTKEHLIPSGENGDLEGIALAIFQKKQGSGQNLIQMIKEAEDRSASYRKEIIRLQENFSDYSRNLNESKDKKEILLEKLKNSQFDNGLLKKQLEKIKNNPKINKIEFLEQNGNRYLIVRTNDLQYSSPRVIYNQGRFTFVFNLTSDNMSVFGSRYYYNYCNPCVTLGGSTCFGEDTNKYNRMLQDGDIIPLILSLVTFLEEPNYDKPHCADYDTFFGQELRPVDGFDFEKLSDYVTKVSEFRHIVDNNFDVNLFDKECAKKNGGRVRRLRDNSDETPEEPYQDED